MNIFLTGCPHNMFSVVQKAASELNIQHMSGIVELDFVDFFIGAEGYTHGDTEVVYIEVSLKDPLGNPYSDEYLTRIIAHELVHAQQYLSGRLVQQECSNYTFNGREYDNWDDVMSPWEVEAYSLEEKIVSKIS